MKLHIGDCVEVLSQLPEASVDAVVTDPPYGLSFMGKRWDYDVPSVDVWQQCLRVLKPGGHMLAFAGTRTQHRMAVRIEDAGFEIRDMIAWVYGSGFPKSLDVSKGIDKAAGAEREVVGKKQAGMGSAKTFGMLQADGQNATALRQVFIPAPAADAAKQWAGWGTALKPALEPITVARKPFGGTVSGNVLQHGTGALNVDGCRVVTDEDCSRKPSMVHDTAAGFGKGAAMGGRGHDAGRWPANFIHDGSDEVIGAFTSTASSGAGAARFFYCAKASKRDRDEGCDGLTAKANADWPQNLDGNDARGAAPRRNIHPTVKPTDLMRYLCRLVTPPGGIVLDPFMGSGSTGKAATLEGFGFVGIERDTDYFRIAEARIAWAQSQPNQQGLKL